MKKLLSILLFAVSIPAFASLGTNETETQQKLKVLDIEYGKNWNIITKSAQKDKDSIEGIDILKKEKLIGNTLSGTQEIWSQRVNKIALHFFVFPQSSSYSFSNADSNQCKIDISYNNTMKPVLLKNIDDDIVFTTLHEVSHCYLNKSVFLQPMDWKINIKNSQKEEADGFIEDETNRILKNAQCTDKAQCSLEKQDKGVLPMVVYHEIFADTMGSILWLHTKGNNVIPEIQILSSHRLEVYNKSPNTAQHVSYNALNNIITESNEKHIDWKNLTNQQIFDLAIILSQDAFFKYLKTREDTE